MICGSGRSNSRIAKAAAAEPAGQMRHEKVHAVAVVARSTCRSQNVKKHTMLGPFLEVTKGSLGYLSSVFFSANLVLGEVCWPFPRKLSAESKESPLGPHPLRHFDAPLVRSQQKNQRMSLEIGDIGYLI